MAANNIIPGHKGAKKVPLLERFWAKVDRRGDDECWPWTASRHQRGYGQIYLNGRQQKATRISWEIANGQPFPEGMDACHSCDNPNCVNPKHIWPGTKSQNIRDAISKGRMRVISPSQHNAVKVRCSRGHPFDEKNTYFTPRGTRVCRKCQRATNSAWKKRKRSLRIDKAARISILEAQVARMAEALEFYADPDTYAAIGFFPDRPCGEFVDDFSDEHDPGYPKPGKRARAALTTPEHPHGD